MLRQVVVDDDIETEVGAEGVITKMVNISHTVEKPVPDSVTVALYLLLWVAETILNLLVVAPEIPPPLLTGDQDDPPLVDTSQL